MALNGAVVCVVAVWSWRVPELAEVKGYVARKLRPVRWVGDGNKLREVR